MIPESGNEPGKTTLDDTGVICGEKYFLFSSVIS